MKKTKAKTRKISIIFIVLFLILGVSIVLYATEPETTDFVCEDINLYDALVKDLDDYAYRTDRNTKTIKIITTDIASIKELELANAQITKLTGMEGFTSLESVNLSGNNITSVEPISAITTLKTLDISGNKTSITDLETLSNLTNLINVNFASSNLTNIDFMGTFSKLQVLDVSGNPALSSLEPIKQVTNLQKLNIAGNQSFNYFQTEICCHTGLTYLDISKTGVQVLDGIETNLRNLETLKLRYLNIELDPIVATYQIEVDNKKVSVPYLDKLQVLDISYTTKSITFSQLAILNDSLRDLYMINVVGETTTSLSLSKIYELGNLNYINLADNNIKSIDDMYYVKVDSDGNIEEEKWLGATQIYLNKNNISDINVLTLLKQNIEILNLSENKISDTAPLESCNFTSDRQVDLSFQDVSLDIFKKSSVDQYIILPEIFQASKDKNSIIYSEDSEFITKCNDIVDAESIRVNNEEIYLQRDYYNVIINKTKTKDDVLTLQLAGNSIATGSKITFKLGTSTSNVDSILFRDPNLCQAIKDNLAQEEFASKVKYIKNAHMIMNINNSAIKNIDRLHLGSRDIFDLSGMENFTGLTNLVLSNNKITTIDQLQYCTKMLNLEVVNNNIGDNNTAIQEMKSIQRLDLSNTGMTNIKSIEVLTDYWKSKKRFTLTSLNLSGNGFTNKDLERIEEIASLTELYVANNKLNEVESFADLNSTLTIFDVSQNKIEDVSTIGTFTNLISLNLSNNKIKNILPIANCTKLNELNISVNEIEDINPLNRISSAGILVSLNMNNNRIKDVSAVDKTQINQLLLAENQKMTQVITDAMEGTVSIDLPQIFTAANNSNSRFYDNGKGLKLSIIGKADGTEISEYCTLSSDGKSIQVNADKLEDEIILVKIQDGNADNTTLSIAAPLEGTLTYNPSNEIKTNQDITATISFNRSNVTITNNNGKNNYTFTENGEFTFEYIDEYGFEGTTTAIVNNIDKVAPQCTEIKKEIVDKKVVVTIKSNEIITQPDGWSLAEDKLSITKTYAEDANVTVNLVDEAGNTTPVNVEIKIDKTVPKITGVENGVKYNKPVTPVVEDENLNTVTLTKDGTVVANYQLGTIIKETGIYVITATDKFENTTTISFEIDVSDIITSEEFTVTEEEQIVKDINPNTTATQFKQKIQAEMEYEIIDRNGTAISETSNVGTGYKIKMESGKTYAIIILGDSNGDGQADLRDILAINKHRLNKANLTAEYLQAGDVNEDGKADLRDILQINKYRLGKINEL